MSAKMFVNAHTMESKVEGALRSLRGEMDGNGLRVMPQGALGELTPATMMGWCEDFYSRKSIEVASGVFKPQRVGSWKKTCEEYATFLRARLSTNWTRLQEHPPERVAVAIIPASYLCPHPSMAQADAWQRRWDDGGDLQRLVAEQCPGAVLFPVMLYEGSNPKSHVQFSLVLVRLPPQVMAAEVEAMD